jgi:hypothetical protein
MTGDQLSSHFTPQNRPKMSDKKNVYFPLPLLASFQTHGSTSFARLQREALSRSKPEARDTSRNSA